MVRYARFFLVCCVLSVLTLGPLNCAPKTIQTPAGKAAWSADIALKAIGAVQDSAIQANQATPKLMQDGPAIALVKACVAIETVLKATPSGWQATVLTGWQQAKAAIPPADAQRLATLIAAVDIALSTLPGGVQ